MPDDTPAYPERIAAFQDRVLAALAEVQRYTRAGVQPTLERIQRSGALRVAKDHLTTIDTDSTEYSRFLNQPCQYFWTAKRVGRLDLSLEAIALDPAWRSLFTDRELAAAEQRLREHGQRRKSSRLIILRCGPIFGHGQAQPLTKIQIASKL